MRNLSSSAAPHNVSWTRGLSALLASCALAAGVACVAGVQNASAQTLDELEYQYQAAVGAYQDAIQAQIDNETEIESLQEDIQVLEQELVEEREELDQSTVQFYKSYPGRAKVIDMILDCDSLEDALQCLENYNRIERYYVESVKALAQKRADLSSKQDELEKKRQALENSIAEAKGGVDAASAAYWDANHSDGRFFHQRQGVSNNCGATAFIVGVNILLHENRFTDNVAVWKGAGFNSDSTTDLAGKGAVWLAVNQLSEQIGIETIAGDIHTADQLRQELEQGNVVVISSGSGSAWRYADGKVTTGLFPYGHWIVFYYYNNGIYYANDSSATSSRGAGCPYSEADLQAWLDGRGNHFAVRLFKKQSEQSQDGWNQL